MVYNLIYYELLEIFGNFDVSQWQFHAVEISTFVLTCLFVVIFMAIPTYLLTWCFSMFDEKQARKRKRR